MLKLAEHYGDRPASEYPQLFQRILQNTLRDHFRRSKVRNFWLTLLSAFTPKDDEQDPLEMLHDEDNASAPAAPDQAFQQKETMRAIEHALGRLPPRQREAFLLRYWEGMDISETARIMGCTEGSVKTHCSRAVQNLSASLKSIAWE